MAKNGNTDTRLLDLRFVIALLFLILGVLVAGAGVLTDEADIERAGGININLWTGGAMLLLSGTFFLWLVKAPAEVAHSSDEARRDPPDATASGQPSAPSVP